MALPWRAANVWRIIRDIDLDGIRARALATFELWIVADEEADALATAELVTAERHPWVLAMPAERVPDAAPSSLAAVLLITRTLALSERLGRVRDRLRAADIAVMTIVVGQTGPAASARGAAEQARVAVTALDDSAVAPVAASLLSMIPDDRRLALARQLPRLRPALFDGIIHETAQANASFALTTGLAETVPVLTAPLNVGDVVVLTKNQLMLGYRIVLASGRSGEPRKLIGEILGVLGGGLLFRQIARQLVGLVPVAGLVPKVAIAYSGTWAIGRAIAAWANEGRTITGDVVRTYSAEAMGRGRALADRLVSDALSLRSRRHD
jgi:uncharacterized protein (DUF697 family)